MMMIVTRRIPSLLRGSVEVWVASEDILILFDEDKTLKNIIILYLLNRPYCAFVKVGPIVP
jgi:hypothetical protein